MVGPVSRWYRNAAAVSSPYDSMPLNRLCWMHRTFMCKTNIVGQWNGLGIIPNSNIVKYEHQPTDTHIAILVLHLEPVFGKHFCFWSNSLGRANVFGRCDRFVMFVVIYLNLINNVQWSVISGASGRSIWIRLASGCCSVWNKYITDRTLFSSRCLNDCDLSKECGINGMFYMINKWQSLLRFNLFPLIKFIRLPQSLLLIYVYF